MVGGLVKRALTWRKRRQERMLMRYAAAQINHLVGDWLPDVQNVNDLITGASPIIRPRMRQLVRDFPPFAAAVNRLVQFTVGCGVQFQSRVLDDDGEPDIKARTAIEDVVKAFMDECDVAGSPAFRQHYYELQQLAKRQELESGEFLAVLAKHRNPRNKLLPWGLQLIETDRLTDLGGRALGGNKMSGGVEYDQAGAIVAFHVEDEGYGKVQRVPAEHAVFGFHRHRPGQLRGMTPFAPAVLLAHDIHDAIAAEVDAHKLASKWMAVVTTPDIESYQRLRQLTDHAGNPADKTVKSTPVEQLENAIIEYLRPGESIEFKSHTRGDTAFRHFTSFLLRLVAIAVDLPYEMLSGDYSGLNYTQMRVVRNDFAQQIAPSQDRQVRQFDHPIINRVIEEAVLRGQLRLPGYWANPRRYHRAVWVTPGMRPVDPQREFKAAVEAIKAGLRSPQEIILERGGDPEQVLDDLKSWQAMCRRRGLDFDLAAVSTANANNPAAVSGESSEASGRQKLRAVK